MKKFLLGLALLFPVLVSAQTISGLSYNITDSTIVATWTTNTSADSNITCGGKNGLDNGVAANSTSHQAVVVGLLAGTVYSCTVTSGSTTSSPQNVTTATAHTNVAITSIVLTGPTVSTGFGDTLYNATSNDNITYIQENDGQGIQGSTPTTGENIRLEKFTSEGAISGTNVNLMTAYCTQGCFNGTDGPASNTLTNKSSGVWAMNGSLFIFQHRQFYNGTIGVNSYYQNIIRSDDHGATWNNFSATGTFNSAGIPVYPNSGGNTVGPFMFTNQNFGFVSPVMYAADDGTLGYNTTGNQIDGANAFVYVIIMDTAHVNSDHLLLGRIPRIRLATQDYSANQYWIGPTSPTSADFVNDSNWQSGVTGLTSIYVDTGSVTGGGAGRVSRPSMAFIPTLNEYLMLTWYRPSGQTTTNNATWVILTGPTPAGPWTVQGTQNNNPSGWYNPIILHRTAFSNTQVKNVNIQIIYQGDFNNQVPYYHPTQSTIRLNPNEAVTSPISIVQQFPSANTTGAPGNIVSPSATFTSGNLIDICVRTGSNQTVSSISGAGGNAFVPGNIIVSSGQRLQHWWAYNINGFTGTITANFTGASGSPTMYVWEVSGLTKSAAFDQQQSGTTAGTSPITTGSYTTTSASEIILACASNNGNYTVAPTWAMGSPLVTDNSAFPTGGSSPFGYSSAGHQIVSAIQTNRTDSASFSGGTGSNTATAMAIVTFQAQPVLATTQISPFLVGR